MKNILSIITLLVGTLLFFGSCDELEGPVYYEENKTFSSDTINKILIEEFTGHKCGNCPRAHERLNQLEENYQDAIIPVAYHVGFFALPSTSGDAFNKDLRTTEGDEINAFFNVSEGAGLPAGIVNRTAKPGDENNAVVLYEQDWESVVSYYVNKPVDALMNIDVSYAAENRSVEGTVNIEFLNDLNKEMFLVLYISEDSIVGWQKDYDSDPVDIENYVHRHVFRDAINSTWGKPLVDEAVAGQIENKSFSYSLAENWEEKHCEIIAYIYDAETLEVIQAEHEKVIAN